MVYFLSAATVGAAIATESPASRQPVRIAFWAKLKCIEILPGARTAHYAMIVGCRPTFDVHIAPLENRTQEVGLAGSLSASCRWRSPRLHRPTIRRSRRAGAC